MSRKTTRKVPQIDLFKQIEFIKLEDLSTRLGGSSKWGESDAVGQVGVDTTKNKKINIPAPSTDVVEAYDDGLLHTEFNLPVSYIRFPRKLIPERYSAIEYTLDKEDMDWYANHLKFGKRHSPSVDLDDFEIMINVLEKATGTGEPIILEQAEVLFMTHLKKVKPNRGEWSDIFSYWLAKLNRLGKPLLRRFWPVTSLQDTNPHKVFRPREKERYKLRRSRKNDRDSFRKMKLLQKDFDKLENILELINIRERMKKHALELQEEIFNQTLYDLTDTSNKPRPLKFKPGEFSSVLQPAIQGYKQSLDQVSNFQKSDHRKDEMADMLDVTPPSSLSKLSKNLVLPVMPSFLDDLPSRDVYPLNEIIQPNLPVYPPYSPQKPESPVRKFRCRTRLGRGGRVVCDRLPVRDSGLGTGSTNDPIVIYSTRKVARKDVHDTWKLLPPFYLPNVDEGNFEEICAEEDNHEALVDKTGLGFTKNVEIDPQTQKIMKYMISV